MLSGNKARAGARVHGMSARFPFCAVYGKTVWQQNGKTRGDAAAVALGNLLRALPSGADQRTHLFAYLVITLLS